jgi:hypothetical protein
MSARPPLDPSTAKAYRRAFRFRMGPGIPPVQPVSDEAAERLLDTTELAAIYPGAGEGWRAPR